MQVSTKSTGTARVNGAELYFERRGSGPSVLFISGATGDAEHFERVAELFAGEFTVVTYDRRGNSRSPRPAGWTTTTMDEQADDAAGLIRALGLAPAGVFGTSGGAVILINLVLRHPEVLRGAIIHEPPLLPVLPNAEELAGQFQTMTEEALARGGPRGAMEAFVRFNAGDANFERLDPALRERMLGNGELFFATELAAFTSYIPDAGSLALVRTPIQVMAGVENRGVYLHDASLWLAERLGIAVQEVPGAHVPYFSHPRELAAALQPFLLQISG